MLAILCQVSSLSENVFFHHSCTSSGVIMPQQQRFVWIIEKIIVCVCFHIITDESFCPDHTSQVQQSVLVAAQQLPCLSEAVGGPQEDERHRLGRKNPGAGEKPLFCSHCAFYSHSYDII